MKQKHSGHNRLPHTRITVIKRAVVSDQNLAKILGVTAFDQHPQINQGDIITVVVFHNKLLKVSGTVTIWHNKAHAAIKTYSSSLAGEWIESLNLVVSEELEEGWTPFGELVTGRLAMDTTGVPGIYSCGEFYSQGYDSLAVAI